MFWDRAISNHVVPEARTWVLPVEKTPGEPCKIRLRDNTPCVNAVNADGGPKVTPSSGASWEANCKDGGTHNWFFDYFHKETDRKVSNAIPDSVGYPCDAKKIRTFIVHHEDLSVPYTGHHEDMYVERKRKDGTSDFLIHGDLHKKRLPHSDLLTMWYDSRNNEVREERGYTLGESFETLIQMSRTGRWDHTNVRVIPLKEPLKIRNISKGNALKYWLAKPVQKLMRDLTRKYPQLVLTKAPLDEPHIRWLWEKTDTMVADIRLRFSSQVRGLDLEFTFVVSGDFKGATDRLDILVTKIGFEAFLGLVDFPIRHQPDGNVAGVDCPTRAEIIEMWKDTLRDVLYEQMLHYPEANKDGGITHQVPTTEQNNGQLMGSNLSFPILCLANLIGYWMTLEEYTGLKFEPSQLPVLINGDDILFRTPKPRPDDPKSFYELWKKNIDALGFKLSVGKNYVHDTVFTVNSQCWVVSGAMEAVPQFRRIRHLDVGILTNENAGMRQETRVLPLAERLNQVLAGAHNKERAWKRLKSYYRKELKEWMQVGRHTTFNVFSAVALGGLGVETHGVDPGFSKFQKRLGHFLRKRLLGLDNQDQLKSCESIALSVEKEGESLCYQIPVTGRRIQWVNPEIFEEEKENLLVTKDIRDLPVISRAQAIDRSSWVRKYTIRSLKLFRNALSKGVVSFDKDPTKFDFVLALNPVKNKVERSGDRTDIPQGSGTAKTADGGFLKLAAFSTLETDPFGF